MVTWRCAGCGGENPDGFKFCGHCGTKVETASAPVAEPSAAPPAGAPAGASAGAPAGGAAADPGPQDDQVTRLLRSFVDSQVADRLVEAGGRLAEERRLVTALFADLSGFTGLAARLDPEQLLEVIDPVIRGLTGIVGRHGGYVEKFAGDALLALFGAPVAHEDDAERALRVALDMHRELPRLAGDLGDQLNLSIGVNTGHAVARVIGHEVKLDYAVLGESVVLAQRLQSQAPCGRTYVGESTAGCVRGRFDLTRLDPLQVKGRVEPVAAWELLGERTGEAADPAAEAPLVGREREVAVLDGALADGGRGPALLVVTGEPGTGKSRLLDETRRRARAAGRAWSAAACASSRATTPYAPVGDLLLAAGEAGIAAATLLGAGSPDRPAGRDAGADGRLEDLVPEARRREAHRAVLDLLRDLTAAGPLVLALEDVHWADPSTLALLQEVLHAEPGLPLLLCLTARPGAADLADALAGPGIARHLVDLDSVPPPAVRDVLAAAFAPDPPEALVVFLAARTAGNPFFVLESVRALADRGAVVVDGGWRLEPGWDADDLPPTIEGVLAARMDRLPGPVVGVLAAAAVVGRTVPRPLLCAVLAGEDGAGPDVGTALDHLARSRFLTPVEGAGDVLAFSHALLQDAAYARLLRRHRRALHARVAAAAVRLYGEDEGVDVVAFHLYRAEAGVPAVAALRRAGARAAALFANEEATTHLTRAVEAARGCAPELLADLLTELAAIHDLTGEYEAAAAAYREALDAEPHATAARRGLAGVLRQRGELEPALALLDEGLRLADGEPQNRATLQLERGRTHLVAGRLGDAERALREGLAAVPEGAPGAAPLHLQLARVLEDTGRLGEALEHGRTAQRLLGDGHVRELATAARVVGGVLGLMDRLDDAADLLREGLALAERCGGVEEIGGTLLNLGMLELRRGALAEAIGCDERAVAEFRRVGHASGLAAGLANLAEKLLLADRLSEAADRAAEALRLGEVLDDPLTVADALLVEAGVHLRRGDTAAAQDSAERAAALFTDAGSAESADAARELADRARGVAAPG